MERRRLALMVDPVACDGHGVCAELFPERITCDPWGYPILERGPIPPDLEPHARSAVAGCPRMALHLVRQQPGTRAR